MLRPYMMFPIGFFGPGNVFFSQRKIWSFLDLMSEVAMMLIAL